MRTVLVIGSLQNETQRNLFESLTFRIGKTIVDRRHELLSGSDSNLMVVDKFIATGAKSACEGKGYKVKDWVRSSPLTAVCGIIRRMWRCTSSLRNPCFAWVPGLSRPSSGASGACPAAIPASLTCSDLTFHGRGVRRFAAYSCASPLRS
jgi:hypothetical protein